MYKKLLLTTLFGAFALADAPVLLPLKDRTFDQSKFMPDMSLILDTTYTHHSLESAELGHLELPGLVHGILASHDHGGQTESAYNAAQGFNLNYAEMVLSSSVDPYFTLDSVLHFSQSGVEIEEAYITTTSLPLNLRLRAGKMLSNFGRINSQHHHYWDFGDMPLVHQAFLGNHGLNEKGIQLHYNAPTPFYLMAGVEVMQGENESMFGNEGLGDEANPVYDAVNAPSLYIAYLKSSVDIGTTTLLGGFSYAQGSSRIDHSEDETPYAISGDASLVGVDLTVKHYFDSYSYLAWQSEWLSRNIDGTQYTLDENTTVTGSGVLDQKQSGFYTQLVYAADQNWRYGLRWDKIYQNSVIVGGLDENHPNNLNRYTMMMEYHPSEFSRIRLQYNYTDALEDDTGAAVDLHTVSLQMNFAIGAHSAHSF